METARAAFCTAALARPPKQSKLARGYYEAQVEFIEFQREADSDLRGEGLQAAPSVLGVDGASSSAEIGGEGQTSSRTQMELVYIAITVSAWANVVLLILKSYAAVSSGSVAVVASSVDSVLDLVSGGLVWYSASISKKKDPAIFPVGKSRFEPVAIILFSCVMGFAAISLIREGIESIGLGPVAAPNGSMPITLGILAAAVVLKSSLLFFCWRLRTVSASCGALALDHLNDIVSNSATLLAVGIAEAYPVVWWLDPVACIGLSVIMLIVWSHTGREQALLLTSTVATPAQLSRLTYMAYISGSEFVDTVIAYSVGSRLQVEVDIGLSRDMPLHKAHDIGEALSLRIEALGEVERAFVHLDTEFEHKRSIEHICPYSK